MSSGVSARSPLLLQEEQLSPTSQHTAASPDRTLSPRQYVSSPDSTFSPQRKHASPASSSRDGPGTLPGMSKNCNVWESTTLSLPQVEALEAADAIDAVLRKRAEPVHERVKESLVTTLRSRAKISRSLHEIDVEGIAASRGLKTGMAMTTDYSTGSRTFGNQLAASWTSLPDTGLDGGRNKLLQKLDGTQAARVRGLLTHLEFAVQADPTINVPDLLNMSPSATPWYDGPDPASSPLLPGYESPDEGYREDSPPPATIPQEDPWPYDRFKTESRSRISGTCNYTVDGSAAQRLMSFRQNLRMCYNSLGEAFEAIDMDGRGCISFDHFHAHLVRLKLSRCDAEGSIRAVELFKLLDPDANDLITPNDCLRAFEAAAREICKEVKKVNSDRKFEEDALDHGYDNGGAHVRFDKDLCLTGDDALRLATLRRFFELQDVSLIQGLNAYDIGKTGFLRKDAFVCGLLEGGYCKSASEAMDLFRVLDVKGVGSISLRYLEVLDKGERLGATLAEHRPPASPRASPRSTGFSKTVRSGIGSGGLFSDPGRLDGPQPPPRLHARLEQLREWDPDKVPSVSCRDRKPFIGDLVVAADDQEVRLDDYFGNLKAWDLQPGEAAVVVFLEDGKQFRLENPRRIESQAVDRSKFFFKPDVFAKLHAEHTASSEKQRAVRKRPSEMPGAIIGDLLKILEEEAREARERAPARTQLHLESRDAFGAAPIVSRRTRKEQSRDVSSREARATFRDEIRAQSRSPQASPSPRERGDAPPAVGPRPRGSAVPRSERMQWEPPETAIGVDISGIDDSVVGFDAPWEGETIITESFPDEAITSLDATLEAPQTASSSELAAGTATAPNQLNQASAELAASKKKEKKKKEKKEAADEETSAFSFFAGLLGGDDPGAAAAEAIPDDKAGSTDVRKAASSNRRAKLRATARLGVAHAGFTSQVATKRGSLASKASSGTEKKADLQEPEAVLSY